MADPTTFDGLFGGCRRSAVHLEMRDGYMRDEPTFIAWSAGRIELDDPDSVAWRDLVRQAAARGVQVHRARIVSEPLSDYTRFEFDITEQHNIAAGEEVRWLPRRRATNIALPGNDFWLFDQETALINHFNGVGDWIETEVTTDPSIVKLCTSAFETVWERAVPHSEYRPT